MSTEQNNQKTIQELEAAKNKLTKLISTLKENPSVLSDDELDKLSGGFSEVQSEQVIAPFLDVNLVAC